MGRPKEHDDATRNALVEQAGRLLQSEGIDALSLRRLANEAGTTTRAIYSLFGGKEGLLSAMYRQIGDTMTTLHLAVPERDDVIDELVELCRAYRQGVHKHPTLYPLLFGGVPGFTPTTDDEGQARKGFVRVLGALNRGIESEVFEGRSAEVMGYQLWALVHGLATLELKGAFGDPSLTCSLWDDSCRNLIDGFRHPPP